MYSVSTTTMVEELGFDFLKSLPVVFFWIAAHGRHRGRAENIIAERVSGLALIRLPDCLNRIARLQGLEVSPEQLSRNEKLLDLRWAVTNLPPGNVPQALSDR